MANLQLFLLITHVYPPVIDVEISVVSKSFVEINENKCYKFLKFFLCFAKIYDYK